MLYTFHSTSFLRSRFHVCTQPPPRDPPAPHPQRENRASAQTLDRNPNRRRPHAYRCEIAKTLRRIAGSGSVEIIASRYPPLQASGMASGNSALQGDAFAARRGNIRFPAASAHNLLVHIQNPPHRLLPRKLAGLLVAALLHPVTQC